MALGILKKRDAWPLRPSDLPPARARRADPRLRGLEENPLFRWLHHSSRAGVSWKRGLKITLKGGGRRERLSAQMLHDLWLAGIKPQEIAAAFWGYAASARFRNMLVFLFGLFVFPYAGHLFTFGLGRPKTEIPEAGSIMFSAIAFTYLNAALFHHAWMVLNASAMMIEAERSRWERRASLARMMRRQFTMFAKAFLAAMLILAAVIPAGIFGAWLWNTEIGRLIRFAFNRMAALASILDVFPAKARPIIIGALLGTITGNLGGLLLRWTSNVPFKRAVKAAEETFRYWQEVVESKPGTEPRRN